MGKSPTSTKSNADLFPPDQAEIPNIQDSQTGGEMFITMVDKQDPTRVAATLQATRFEPIGEGRRRLDQPESWIYPPDGRAIKITADQAIMLMPDPNEPPESGTLEGNIRIEAYESKLSLENPMLVAQFDEPVEFERRYLRLRSIGHFHIASEQFDFAGSDLTVILNELKDRIELIDVGQGDRIVIHTDAKASTPTPTSTPTATSPTQQASATTTERSPSAPPSTTPQAAPILNRYHIALLDQVNAMIVGTGEARGDQLDLWVALDGSSLPDDAIKKISFVQSDQGSSAEPNPQPSSPNTNSASPASDTKSPKSPEQSSELIITWTGKMTVRPIDDQIPPQLLDNTLSITLGAAPDSGIAIAVPDQEFIGQASSVTYHASQGIVILESEQTEKGFLKLEAKDSGSLVADSLVADLAQGTVELSGRGRITSNRVDSEDDSHATIQWHKNSSFTIAMINDSLTDRLTNALFVGAVVGTQGQSGLGAKSLNIDFDPQLPSSTSLSKLTMVDGVLRGSGRNMLTGTNLEINFAPNDKNTSVDPIALLAEGQVMGRTPDSILKATRLQANLTRDLLDDIVVRDAQANGNVQFSGANRTSAAGDELTIDGLDETMLLIGAPAKLGQGGSSIVGNHIDLDAKRRAIKVTGPGSFDHDILIDNNDPNSIATGHIRATWQGSMRFDDATGSIVCEDKVKVVSTPDAFTRDTLQAHRASIKLNANPTNDPIAGASDNPASSTTDDRQLLWARIFGHAPSGQDPIPAKIESRTYAQDDPERVTSLIYLEGSQILADNQSQTLDVPAPGTLLIMDRSSETDTQSADTDTSDQGVGDGLTRFTWNGNMKLDRNLGTAQFAEQVVVRHKTLSTGKIAQLSTDQLDARFEIGAQTPDQAQTSATTLLGVDAIGSVRFLFEGRELLSDAAIYDALGDSLFASAIDNKLVTLYDDKQPAPMSAKTMKWNLKTDRIEINAPTPSRTPSNTTGG